MGDLFRLTTVSGAEVVLDLEGAQHWEGQKPGTMALVLPGHEGHVEIAEDFDKFVTDWLDYFDARKKKPRAKRGSKSVSALQKAAKA
ncbi:MAG: hypothetical protein V3V96_15620 [Acidiferrobacterales bacterium]